jgi:uncharacterized membrane protein (UPF0127 family)
MRQSWKFAIPFLVGAATLAACTSHDPGRRPVARISTSAGPVVLQVTVADTDAERQRGLQGVRHLGTDAGEVFLFPRPSTSAFWMKDTPLPLSIAFWGPAGRILAMRDMPPCRADLCPTYRPDRPILGALEANRGFFARHGVEVGDRIVVLGA